MSQLRSTRPIPPVPATALHGEVLPPEVPDNLLGYYAGFISRLIAMIVDIVIISMASAATTWFFQITMAVLQVDSFLGFSLAAFPQLTGVVQFLTSPVLVGILIGLFVAVYHVFFWSLAGQTPGKMLLGVRIVSVDGKRLTVFQSMVRFTGYIISGFLFYLGFLWMLVDDRRQTWHDRLAHTYVVYTWAARPDERFLAEALRQLKDASPILPPENDEPANRP